MNPIFQLQRDITRYEADAIYYQDRAEHCRREAALLRQELEEEQTGTRTALENARERATMILKLDGLTGARLKPQRRFSPVTLCKRLIFNGCVKSPSIIHSLLCISSEEFV
jgi:hypothetical protein